MGLIDVFAKASAIRVGPEWRQDNRSFWLPWSCANYGVLMLYAWIYYLSSFDPPLGFPTWHCEEPVGLRPALDCSGFISVRSITDPFLD